MAVDYEEGRRLLAARNEAQEKFGDTPRDADMLIVARAEMAFDNWLHTHAEALLNPDPWRPIEEAPKDGTVILLANGQDTAPGKWAHGDWRAMYFVIDGASDFRAGAGLFQSPTHFRELKGPGQ